MPRMSDTMEEGNIVGWLKKVGDDVEPGDVLAEVETDKATMELESFHEGVLLHIGVEEGAVPVNSVLAVIGEAGEDYEAALADADGGGGGGSAETAADSSGDGTDAPAQAESQDADAVQSEAAPSGSAESGTGEGERVKASPLARSMAAEAGLDLSTVSGSGDNGRIVKRDVEAALGGGGGKQAAAPPSSGAPAGESAPSPMADASAGKPAGQAVTYTPGDGDFEDVPTSQMRKVIARRLAESKFSAPHFYLGIDVEMTTAIEYRKGLNGVAETKISFNDIVVKCVAKALRAHPGINASWLGDHIRYNRDVNVGVAVAVEDGLLVPVVRHADRKGMAEINAEVKEMAGLAKERRLQPQQMQGNTFTISNLGMFDITEFTAIINPPDACILAVGSIKQVPVVKGGAVVPGNVMRLTLSCDHRVVDGATGAKFLATLKGYLENPMTLVI